MKRQPTVSLIPQTLSTTPGARIWIFVILISDVNFMIIACRSSLTTSHRYPQHTHTHTHHISKGSHSDTSIFTKTVTYKPFTCFMFIFVRSETTWDPKALLFYVNHTFDVHVGVHCVKIVTIKPIRCTNFSNVFFILEWMKTGRAAGPGDIPIELLKSGGQKLLEMITILLNLFAPEFYI